MADKNREPVIQELMASNPGNSQKNKAGTVIGTKEVKVGKVISGKVMKKKKTLSQRIASIFIVGDVDNVSSYVIHDVLIPAAKNTISEMISSGIDMLMFTEDSPRSRGMTRDRNKSYVSYSNPRGSSNRRNYSNDASRRTTSRSRAAHNFDDIILETRGDAEEVISNLIMLVEDYGQASVADLYDLVDITSSYTDQKYGWTNLSTATVVRVRSGYLLDLPRTEVI